MSTQYLDGVTVTTRANVYFDGQCVSHNLLTADGSKKSIGVVLPSTLTFTTDAPEVMECVAGECEWRLAGAEAWSSSGPGDRFSIPGQTAFEIRVATAYHYLCHFG